MKMFYLKVAVLRGIIHAWRIETKIYKSNMCNGRRITTEKIIKDVKKKYF